MDSRILAKIPDDYLAKLQAGVGPQTAQYICAQQEWQRRLTVRQVHGALWASVIGVVGTIVGTIVGIILGWFLGHW
jgi:ABC-type dipeptide/oligopeptide/nickel transport system permease subunit